MNLALFPLNTVLFPGMVLPLHVFESRYQQMIAECIDGQTPFGVVLIRSGPEVGGFAEPHPIGTQAHMTQIERLPDGRLNIEVVGKERFRIRALHHDRPYLSGTTEDFPLLEAEHPAARQAAHALLPWVVRYLRVLGEAANTKFDIKRLPRDPPTIAYLAAIVAQVPMVEKQALLSIAVAAELLAQERAIFRREVSLLGWMLGHSLTGDDKSPSPN